MHTLGLFWISILGWDESLIGSVCFSPLILKEIEWVTQRIRLDESHSTALPGTLIWYKEWKVRWQVHVLAKTQKVCNALKCPLPFPLFYFFPSWCQHCKLTASVGEARGGGVGVDPQVLQRPWSQGMSINASVNKSVQATNHMASPGCAHFIFSSGTGKRERTAVILNPGQ